MRKLIAASAVLGVIMLIGGCASVSSPPQVGSTEVALAKQTVKIYDVAPPNASPLDQISATACDGPRGAAMDQLLALTSQRGGNGMTQLSCKSEGMSMACWSSETCTAMALNVPPPPPPPPVVPAKRAKPKAKSR